MNPRGTVSRACVVARVRGSRRASRCVMISKVSIGCAFAPRRRREETAEKK